MSPNIYQVIEDLPDDAVIDLLCDRAGYSREEIISIGEKRRRATLRAEYDDNFSLLYARDIREMAEGA